MKKRINWSFLWGIIVIGIAIGLLANECITSNQAISAVPAPLKFEGIYSQNGGEWLPYDETTTLSAYEGDVIFKGHFKDFQINNAIINCYRNHIGLKIYKEERLIYVNIVAEAPMMSSFCGIAWEAVRLGDLNPADEYEIHLNNPHRFGNKDAYNQLLKQIYVGDKMFLESYMRQEQKQFGDIAIAILIISILLFGTTLATYVLRIDSKEILLAGSLFIFLSSIFIFLNENNVCFLVSLNVLVTYGHSLSMMLSALILGIITTMWLNGRSKQIAEKTIQISAGIDAVLIVMALLKQMVIYDTLPYWVLSQVVVTLILLGCVCKGYGELEKNIYSFVTIILLVIEILELVNIPLGIWKQGVVATVVFILSVVVALVALLKNVLTNYRESIRAKELEAELRNSRIVLAMSQIRTHFIFNVLNAISGMCKYDPEAADETVVRFARYLRNNIDILQDDELILFKKELEHMEDYIALEQTRFGNKIRYESQIEIMDFLIPPLVLQPIVENAIKHGLIPKEEGGTITLHTYTKDQSIQIVIADDGVGYNLSEEERKGAVGMNNVRFRLKHMVQGEIKIESEEGKGTVITIQIPLKEAAECM